MKGRKHAAEQTSRTQLEENTMLAASKTIGQADEPFDSAINAE